MRYARFNVASGCNDLIDVYKRIQGVCGNNRELALDLLAVRDLVMILRLEGDNDTLKALNEIYFLPFAEYPQRQMRKREISYGVLRFAYENNVDERTVYRKLQKARMLWEKVRYSK